MSRFNLVDEEWIPVRFLDGSRGEMGIRDVLLRAKEIAAIDDPSPLVVAALHRFLLAVLYRALEGPTDIDQAKKLFKEGIPGNKITAYLEKWRDRFLLFDEKYPFGQVPTFEPRKWRAWTALAVECNADTAKVLFDHTSEEEPGSSTRGRAGRCGAIRRAATCIRRKATDCFDTDWLWQDGPGAKKIAVGGGDSIGAEVKLDPRCPGVSAEGIRLRRPVEVAW